MKRSFSRSGVGLHSGILTTVTINPIASGMGRYFRRVDLPNQPTILAHVTAVSQTTLSTELTHGEGKVRTVEHLLAALTACGVEDAEIAVDGPELPLLDGSALNWVQGIMEAGITPADAVISTTGVINEPIYVRQEDAFVAAIPSPELRFTYGIDFPDLKPLGNQWHSWHPQSESFIDHIAPARTFGFAHQIEQLRQAGLIKGGSLDNALVCDHEKWINPPLRFTNEPARHKLLDLIGDLSLLGKIPQGHYIAYKASHNLHVELAKKIYQLTIER
jgi:UDP-3-O-[3-hydroxymyristoyl] N-acetylglucosamine deacetylase